MSRAAQRGFTLLEAIVALVLVATTGMALFGWINSNIIALTRVQAVNERAEATANILAYMNTVNPMLKPEGAADLGAYRFTWRAQPITAAVDGANYPSGMSLYRLALYRTEIAVAHASGDRWFDFELRQVGYRKVRSLQLPFS